MGSSLKAYFQDIDNSYYLKVFKNVEGGGWSSKETALRNASFFGEKLCFIKKKKLSTYLELKRIATDTYNYQFIPVGSDEILTAWKFWENFDIEI